MHFKTFQRKDLPRAAMHDGLILSWDTGLGKGLALIAWPLLKVGFTRGRTVRGGVEVDCIQANAPVLLVVPGDLHKQVADEAWLHFKVPITPIDSQATFGDLVRIEGSHRWNVAPDGRAILKPGFYITSYTQLATNGVESIPDPDDCDDPRAMLQRFCLQIGDRTDVTRKGDRMGTRLDSFGKQLPKLATWDNRPDFEDVCHFFSWRHVRWSDQYELLELDPEEDTLATFRAAVEREIKAADDIDDEKTRAKVIARIRVAEEVLQNLFTLRAEPSFARLSNQQQDFVIRAFLTERMEHYARGNHETRDYSLGPPPEGYDKSKPETDTRIKLRVKCIYSVSLSDLCYRAFDCVAIDEGVKMKGEDTLVGKGVRQMDPKYRLILTATPIKNRLPDIFRLAWWAAGGKIDAHPRWPYADDSAEREKFAETFMVSERNLTKEEAAAERGGSCGGRFKKLTPEVCNVHLLWKLLGPIVLRRRKDDTGEDIVPKVRKVIRVEMGTEQQRVYRYHLDAQYLDKNDMPAIGAQLQALRMAAADPSSSHLKPAGGMPSESCDCHVTVEVDGKQHKEPKKGCPKCKGSGRVPLPERSAMAYIPKHATALSVVQEVLDRKEQVVVFSAFNDPLDHLSKWLTQANVRHITLDGRTSQKARGRLAAIFKKGRHSALSTQNSALPDAPIPVMLAGVECVAEGHSFHLANNVILIAYSWAYDKFKQALDRVHRMNSQKPVNVYVILCTGTIDAKLESLVNDKGDASELCLDGRLIGERTEEVNLAELLRVAHREFDEKTKTIDEGLLLAQWPGLRDRLAASMRAWDEGCGVPVTQYSTHKIPMYSRNPIRGNRPVRLGSQFVPPTPHLILQAALVTQATFTKENRGSKAVWRRRMFRTTRVALEPSHQ